MSQNEGISACSPAVRRFSGGPDGSTASAACLPANDACEHGTQSRPRRVFCAHCGLPASAALARDGRPYCCTGCWLVSRIVGHHDQRGPAAWNLLRLGFGAFLAMDVMMLSLLLYAGTLDEGMAAVCRWVLLGLATPAMAILGYPFAQGAWREIRDRRLSLDTLIALGAFAAYGVSAADTIRGEGHIFYDSATMLLALVTIGRMLEAAAKTRAGDLLRSLETLLPDEATRLRDGRDETVKLAELRVGDVVRVLPGGRIGVDGRVVSGSTLIAEAAFTGESRPRPVGVGDEVLAGCINGDGAISVAAAAVGEDLLLMRIAEMTQQAMQDSSPYQRLAMRLAAAFVPAVLVLAVAAAGAWLALGEPSRALLAGLAVLVVACPCALGIATPLATAVAMATAARNGVLVRGGGVMERIGQVSSIYFDKTGTLTLGQPSVRDVRCFDSAVAADDLLAVLAALESQSEHSLARAVVAEAQARGLAVSRASNVRAVPGCGVEGDVMVGGARRRVIAGSLEYLLANACSPANDACEHGTLASATLIYVAWEGRLRGVVSLTDAARPESAAAVAALKGLGLEVAMLSGDRREPAMEIARQVGIENVNAACRPDDKLRVLRRAGGRGCVAMVGDGINDAPALAGADIGIAIGAGTDIARAAGSVVLLSDDLAHLPWLVKLGRRTRRIIAQNLFWAGAYNAVALAAAAAGVLHPLLAVAAMMVSSITVLSNSLRLGR